MLNRDCRKLNMDELSQVAGGIRVLCEVGSLEIAEPEIIDPMNEKRVGIPRGGTISEGIRIDTVISPLCSACISCSDTGIAA